MYPCYAGFDVVCFLFRLFVAVAAAHGGADFLCAENFVQALRENKPGLILTTVRTYLYAHTLNTYIRMLIFIYLI